MDEQTRPRPRPRPSPDVSPSATSTAEPEASPAVTARRTVWPWWTALGVLILALAASITWLVALVNRDPVRPVAPAVDSQSGAYTPGNLADADGHAAVQATVAYLPGVLSYDYRSLAAGLASAKQHLTPDFATEFESTFTQTVEPIATKNKAVVRTLVRGAGLAGIEGNTASVLVFVDQALVSADGKTAPKISPDRVHVDLIRSKGQWLISKVTPF